MAAGRLTVAAEGSQYASAPLLQYIGESGVTEGFRLSQGHAYRVLVLKGCGALLVRVYDPGNVCRFADVSYSNLAAFMGEWKAV